MAAHSSSSMRQKSSTSSSDEQRTRSHADHSFWAIPGASSFQRIGRSVGSRKKHDSRSATAVSASKSKSKVGRIVRFQLNDDAAAKLDMNHQQKQQRQAPPQENQEQGEEQRDPPPPPPSPPLSSPPPPSMKRDSRFGKYWSMHNQHGLSESAVRSAIRRDGLDASILYLDWDKNYEEQQQAKEQPQQQQQQQPKEETKRISGRSNLKAPKQITPPPPLIITIEEVSRSVNGSEKNRNVSPRSRDSRDAAPPLREDPRQSKESKRSSVSGISSGRDATAPPAKGAVASLTRTTDSRFEKFCNMKAVGMTGDGIRHAIQSDGQAASVWDMFWDKKFKNGTPKSEESREKSKRSESRAGLSASTPMKDDSRFQKYWKMKMVGLPDGAVCNAIRRHGLDDSIWDLDWEKNYEEQMAKSQRSNFRGRRSSNPLPMKKDERFKKYWKMKTVGLPDGAIRNAMWRDGLDGSVLDNDSAWEMNYESQGLSSLTHNEHSSTMNDSSSSMTEGGQRNRVAHGSMVVQKKVRRKKIFWRTIDPGHIKENSLWSMVRSRSMSLLSFDSREFNELFIESADHPNEQQRNKKKSLSATTAKPTFKRAVQVIDVKRSMNGGIVLARLRMEYEKIATIVGNMEHGQLDATQLKALKDLLPTDEERQLLQMHMGRAQSSEENSNNTSAFSCLSECEKYMFTMMHVSNAQNKLDCMLFREQFHSRFNDLITSIQTLDRACDEVKNSEKLREILGIILIVVNRMNTGGVGNRAVGFSLEALLKLNETKAFDKKTSVLHYLVKLVKRNNESLLEFYDDLGHVGQAKNIVVDSLFTEIKKLKKELVEVHKTAQKHTDQLSGEESFFSLKRIMQQITPVRIVSGVPHYNKTDHITEGMCPMERFTVNAAVSTETAFIMTQAVKRKYMSLLEYLGEVEEMASNDCFGTIERFITEFRRATEQVQKEETAKTHKLKRASNTAKNLLSQNGKVKRKELVSNVDETTERNDTAMDERSSTGSEKRESRCTSDIQSTSSKVVVEIGEDRSYEYECEYHSL